ncbi:MAG: BON domain-containing protein [Pirellulales bacterium]
MRRLVFLVLLGVTLLPATAATAQTAAEKGIAQRISSHLEESGQLRKYRIGVTYIDGVASLEGTVASAQQRDTAVRLAEQISGVSQVICRLQYPGEGDFSAGNGERNLSSSLGDAKLISGQGEPSGVVQAYGNNGAMASPHARRAPLFGRNSSRTSRGPQMPRGNMPLPAGPAGMNGAIQQASAQGMQQAGGFGPPGYGGGGPMMGGGGMGMQGMQAQPAGFVPHAHGRGPSYENAQMPGYAWPSYASYPNYAALSYPQQYSPTAWPYIGPFYPYPQVPLAWRKVSLEWDDGWWFLDFSAHNSSH